VVGFAPGTDSRVRLGALSRLAGRISHDIVAEVKQAADIVEVIARYVSLKKSGRTFKALCPFHTEKTPSFIVNPERQLFRCFGCGKAGDVFSFVAEHERVEFPEALRIVASAVGVSVPDRWGQRAGQSQEVKARLYKLHTWAARFFARRLAEGADAAGARKYLASRHFDKEILEAWGVGYAPNSWDDLSRAAHNDGYTDPELLAAGLVISREGGAGHYDRFRNRIVFPIRDVQGRVIAFGARALEASDVKYINSPETPLFSKSRCLYGLDQARAAVVQERRILVTEGYTDTLMCHQMSIPWAVATLGTALTRDHVGLLKRYADLVVLLFDADQAGETAVDRSLEVFADAELDVRAAALEPGTDPCEFLLAHGAEAFIGRVDAARGLFDVKLDFACRRHHMETLDGRARAADEALRSIALVSNVAKADLLTEGIAKRVGIDRDSVRRRLAMLRKRPRKGESQPKAGRDPELDPVEAGILRAVLASNELVPCVLARASLQDFQDARVRSILEQCIDLYDREGEIDLATLTASLQDNDLTTIVARMALSASEQGNWERWVQDCLERLEDRRRRLEIRHLKEQALGSPEGSDPQALAAILKHHRRRAGRVPGTSTD